MGLNILYFCREEESLVEQFVFEALVIYMESLALAHADEKSLGRCLLLSLRVDPVCLQFLTALPLGS